MDVFCAWALKQVRQWLVDLTWPDLTWRDVYSHVAPQHTESFHHKNTFITMPVPTSKPECYKTKLPFFFEKVLVGSVVLLGHFPAFLHWPVDDSQQARSSKGAPTSAWVSSAHAQGIPSIDLPRSNRGFLPSIFFNMLVNNTYVAFKPYTDRVWQAISGLGGKWPCMFSTVRTSSVVVNNSFRFPLPRKKIFSSSSSFQSVANSNAVDSAKPWDNVSWKSRMNIVWGPSPVTNFSQRIFHWVFFPIYLFFSPIVGVSRLSVCLKIRALPQRWEFHKHFSWIRLGILCDRSVLWIDPCSRF